MKTKKLTALALLTSISLIIFIIESQIPPLAPIPGIKLGLANIITMITMRLYGRKEAFLVLIMRIILASVFTGHMMSFIYSLSGGIFCFAAMALTIKHFKNKQLWIVSIFGAAAHNTGQIAAAVISAATIQIAAYLPILLISGMITGAFTGFTAEFILNRLTALSGRKIK